MSRRPVAMACLVAFLLCTAVAVGISGGRPAAAEGGGVAALQAAGCLLGLVAALLLLDLARRDRGVQLDRTAGLLLLVAVVTLGGLDFAGGAGAADGVDPGARLLHLATVGVVLAGGFCVAAAMVAERRTSR